MKLLICILNHNNNANAVELARKFCNSYPTIIIDSGSDEQHHLFKASDTPYYTGNFNKACELFLSGNIGKALYKRIETYFSNSKFTHCLFICSDVTVKDNDYLYIINRIEKAFEKSSVGCYSPSIIGQGWEHMKKKTKNSLRPVQFAEGIGFCIRRDIIEQVHPIDHTINEMGWGIDLYIGYQCKKAELSVVIDDAVSFIHPDGTSYNEAEARRQWFNFTMTIGDEFRKFSHESMAGEK